MMANFSDDGSIVGRTDENTRCTSDLIVRRDPSVQFCPIFQDSFAEIFMQAINTLLGNYRTGDELSGHMLSISISKPNSAHSGVVRAG